MTGGLDDALPCPWCDTGEYLLYRQLGDYFAVQCGNCGCIGPMAQDAQTALGHWNYRLYAPRKVLDKMREWLDRCPD